MAVIPGPIAAARISGRRGYRYRVKNRYRRNQGAGRSYARQKHLNNIEQRILTDVTTLPYDVATAKVFGQIRAKLETADLRL